MFVLLLQWTVKNNSLKNNPSVFLRLSKVHNWRNPNAVYVKYVDRHLISISCARDNEIGDKTQDLAGLWEKIL
jgi:hypothetical protein